MEATVLPRQLGAGGIRRGIRMSFSESVKRQVKERAAFRCCRCQQTGVDVHHITPLKDGGSDDIGNAAPLCQNCHDQLGDNPSKRKEIIHMRDWWYAQCERTFSPSNLALYDQINTRIERIQTGQSVLESDLTELKAMLKGLSNKMIENLNPGTAGVIASGFVNMSTAVTSATQLADRVYADFRCSKCNMLIGLLVGTNQCPNCGNPILPRTR